MDMVPGRRTQMRQRSNNKEKKWSSMRAAGGQIQFSQSARCLWGFICATGLEARSRSSSSSAKMLVGKEKRHMGKVGKPNRIVCETITYDCVVNFVKYLYDRDFSPTTIEKHCAHVAQFADFAEGREVSQETLLAWKNYLMESNRYKPSVINAKISSVNTFFRYMGRRDSMVELIPIRRKLS